MNKKLLLIVIFVITFITLIVVINNKGNDKDINIPEYDANIICRKEYKEDVEDDEYTSSIVVYIFEKDGYLNKVIKQVILNNDNNINSIRDLNSLYASINGIDSNIANYGDLFLWELNIDMTIVDFNDVREKFGSLLDDSSIFNSNDLPIKTDDYIELELNTYTCEEN